MVDITKFFNLGVTTANTQVELQPQDLCPNNYLTIIWKDVQTGQIVNTLDYDDIEAVEYTNKLNASIDNAIRNNNVTYIGQNKYINIEAIAKYLAQNIFPAGVSRSVVNALIGVASGLGKKTPDDLVNLCLNVFGTIADKTARKLGFTDPHEIFSQVSGQNVITVLGELGNQTNNVLNNCKQKINNFLGTNLFSISGSSNTANTVKYAGLLLGLTTSDTESYEITIPRRKVEEGSDYTTHLLPQPWKKEFSVKLTNKILSENFDQNIEIQNIENIKNKLIEIAQSRTTFDIYIRLSNDIMYKKSNVVFSSLSFSKDEDSGNGYTATFTIEPITSFKTKYFVSDKKYKAKMRVTGNTTSGTGSKTSGTTNRPQNNKTTNGDSLEYGYYKSSRIGTAKNTQEMKEIAKQEKKYIKTETKYTPEFVLVDPKDVTEYDGRYVLLSDLEPFQDSFGWSGVSEAKWKYKFGVCSSNTLKYGVERHGSVYIIKKP